MPVSTFTDARKLKYHYYPVNFMPFMNGTPCTYPSFQPERSTLSLFNRIVSDLFKHLISILASSVIVALNNGFALNLFCVNLKTQKLFRRAHIDSYDIHLETKGQTNNPNLNPMILFFFFQFINVSWLS